jgi:2',3'-cyclic-nucleotide 2'-phosphodiesterase (5'-nucleotidase family)
MQRLILLHSNDIHGRVAGLARIATLVAQIRQTHPEMPVLYVDLGDLEDTTNRLSNLTKGVAMHQLLSLAGCDAAVIGNACTVRYGPQIVAEQARVARYPLLLANLRTPEGALLPGMHATVLLTAGALRLGLIGLTSPLAEMEEHFYEKWFGMQVPPALPLIQELAATLRSQGADAVLLLSHLGLNMDRQLAAELQGEIPLILGAHSHHLLPEGERVGDVLIAQAGEFAQHLGRLDLLWDGGRLSVEGVRLIPITEAIQPAPAVLAEERVLEGEAARFLEDIIGELAEPLDFSVERECGVGNFMADVLRERTHADVGLVAVGQAFSGPLPAGPLPRVALWDVCTSPANPGLVELTGAQLRALIARGLDASFARETNRALRGQLRGLFHLSGASVRDGQLFVGDAPIAPERTYRVGASDWELQSYGGYADESWDLTPRFDVPTILREAAEEYLAAHRPVHVTLGRVSGPLLPESPA